MSQTHSSMIVSPARLEALRRLEQLASSAEPAFDRLTMLAAKILKTSVVLISLVDQDRQFFRSFVGLTEPWLTLRETPLSHSFCQYVVASGAPLIIDDARSHALVQNNLAIPDLRVIAYAGIPLITHEEYTLGSFCAIDSTPRAWSDDEISILKDLAAAVMTEIELRTEIIERKQAEETTHRLAEQRKRLLEVAQTVVSTLALDDILPKLQRTLQEVLEHDALSVYWVDEAAGVLQPAHTTSPRWLSDMLSTWPIPLGSGIAGAVGRSGRAELVNDAHLDSRSIYPPGTTSAQPHHMICVPIQINDRTRGVLIMSRNSGAPFTEQEFQLVQLFVSFVALAIENARLFEQTRESEERFSRIFRASPVAYTITSVATGQFVEVNQAFVDLMGYSRDEVIGRTTLELDAWADPADRERIVRMLQQQQSVRSLELTFRTKSGTLLEVLASMEIIELDGERCILSLTQDITSYKRAEAALAEQHSFRAAIIERAAEGLCVCHTINVFPYVAFTVWNDRMTEITGYTIEAINTHGWYQSLYPDPGLQARAIERMARMRYGEDLLAEEWEITRADGAKRVVTISTSVLATADGATHVLALMQDMTERKRAEEALRENQALLQGIVDHSPATIVVQDIAEGRYLLANNRLARILGLNDHQIIGKTRADLFPPELAAEWSAQDRRIAATGTAIQIEDDVLHPDGTLHTSLGTKFPIYDAQGAVYAIGGIFTDITERRRAQEALRESEERFRTLIRDLQVGVLLQDSDAEIILSNRAALNLLGLTEDQLLGKSAFDPDWNVIHEDGSLFPGPDHPVPQAIATREPVRGIIMGIFRPITHDRVWLLVNAEPQLYDDGSIRHIICSFSDVTERMLAEQDRERLIAELTDALTNIKTLSGLLPICSSCKKIRDDHGYWNQIETYIKTHSEADFTHGICPDCIERLYGDLYKD